MAFGSVGGWRDRRRHLVGARPHNGAGELRVGGVDHERIPVLSAQYDPPARSDFPRQLAGEVPGPAAYVQSGLAGTCRQYRAQPPALLHVPTSHSGLRVKDDVPAIAVDEPEAHHVTARQGKTGFHQPLEDLVQVASVGLLNAIDRFDVSRDVQFSTYAAVTIIGELKRHFRDRGWSVHVPRDVQERILKVERALAELSRAAADAMRAAPFLDNLRRLSIDYYCVRHSAWIHCPDGVYNSPRIPRMKRGEVAAELRKELRSLSRHYLVVPPGETLWQAMIEATRMLSSSGVISRWPIEPVKPER